MENNSKSTSIHFAQKQESKFALISFIFIFPTLKVISNVVDFHTNKLTQNLVFADYRDIYTVIIVFPIIWVKTTDLKLDC